MHISFWFSSDVNLFCHHLCSSKNKDQEHKYFVYSKQTLSLCFQFRRAYTTNLFLSSYTRFFLAVYYVATLDQFKHWIVTQLDIIFENIMCFPSFEVKSHVTKCIFADKVLKEENWNKILLNLFVEPNDPAKTWGTMC